jgi:hypothetical protein
VKLVETPPPPFNHWRVVAPSPCRRHILLSVSYLASIIPFPFLCCGAHLTSFWSYRAPSESSPTAPPIVVGTIIVGGFSSVKEAIVEKLGGQPHQAPWRLTFSLSKASPGAYSTCKNANIESFFTLYACDVLWTTYRILG